MTAKFEAQACSWADLPSKLLIGISGRLHDPADFVRFHAVCCSWRATAPLRSPATRLTFPPWLLGLCDGHIVHSRVNFPVVVSSSKPSTDHDHVLSEPAPGDEENWVARADGTVAWLFSASPDPRLIDLISGSITPLPQFPDDDDDIKQTIGTACGTVYKDGTIFLYSTLYTDYPVFTVAILGPGDAAWTIMKRVLELPVPRHRCAVYHDGKVLLSVGVVFWYLLTRDGGGDNNFAMWDDATEGTKKYYHDWNYVMESRGELLWVSVLAKQIIFHGNASVDPTELLVTVHMSTSQPKGTYTRIAIQF
ncbi:hypothetical protein ACQ4PT_021275 [Festuca glaucescens]